MSEPPFFGFVFWGARWLWQSLRASSACRRERAGPTPVARRSVRVQALPPGTTHPPFPHARPPPSRLTTPILLARDKDLPKARKDLGAFVGDAALQREIQVRLEKLLRMLPTAPLKRIEQAVQVLQQRLEETVFSRSVLRSLAHRFVQTW